MDPVKRYIKSHTTWAFRSAVRRAQWEWDISRRHQRSLKKMRRLALHFPVKLNLGSGPNVRPGWLNIDLFHPAADVQLDLREPWPLPDGSVSFIYSEHMFEHFEFQEEVPHLLSESLRVLHPAGVFDVGKLAKLPAMPGS